MSQPHNAAGPVIVMLLVMAAIIGCSWDQQVLQVSREQNQTTRELIIADGESHRSLVEVQQDIVAERASLD